jgi:hypothetical protein
MDNGSFVVLAPPGRYRLHISAPWLKTRIVDAELQSNAPTLTITVTDDDAKLGNEQIIVRGSAPTGVGRTTVTAKMGRDVPGGGDALKVVQALPSVARPPAGSSNLIVWGAAPRDTRVFVDGVPVPSLYHLGGYRAAVGNEFIESVTLSPAAFGADRGGATGGVIDVAQAAASDGPSLVFAADVLDVGATIRRRINHIALAASGRTSVLAPLVGAVVDTEKIGANAPLPQWSDAQVAMSTPWRKSELRLWAVASRDRLRRTLPAADPAVQTTDDVARDFVRSAATLRYTGTDTASELTVWGGVGSDNTKLAVGDIVADNNDRSVSVGARAAERSSLSERFDLTLGLDIESQWSRLGRRGSLSIPAREGDPRIFGQPPGDDFDIDRWQATTSNAGAYVALTAVAPRTLVVAGLRAESWLLTASRLTPRVASTPSIASQSLAFTVSPRVAVKIDLGTFAKHPAQLRIDAGRYLQARDAADTSAVFGTPSLGRENAWHATIGGQWQFRNVLFEAAGYARILSDLVVRDTAALPKLASVLTQQGTGRVIGGQITARLVPWRGVEGWLSYGLSRSIRRDSDTTAWRRFDHDQTHNIVAVVSWRRGPWSVAGRLRIASGEPRTSVQRAFFDSRSGRYQPVRGDQNDVQLPAFVALDARLQRRMTVAGNQLAAYLEVQNITNRANPEEIVYNADFSEQRFLTSLPALAIAGLRWEMP